MNATISLSDLQEANASEVAKLRSIAESFDESGDSSRRFAAHVKAIEGLVRNAYQCSAIMARKSEGMEDTAEIWRRMAEFCDQTLAQLKSLTAQHPRCATEELYDLILDCRNAAARRMELHL